MPSRFVDACLLGVLCSFASALHAADCAAIKGLKLADTTITTAAPTTDVEGPRIDPPAHGLPEFCRVTGVVSAALHGSRNGALRRTGPDIFGQLGTPTAQGPKFGVFDALMGWVEQGTPAGTVVATKYAKANGENKATVTRPLCAYPEVAKYKGAGDTGDAANFACAMN